MKKANFRDVEKSYSRP